MFRFYRLYRPLLASLLCLLFPGQNAFAERIVFQRGDALHVADAEGRDARRLFAVGKPVETLWAPSPDGRRVAWTGPLPAAGPSGIRLADRPVAVYVSDLSGMRRKRLLATNDLRDRRGRRVTRLGLGDAKPAERAEEFAAWLLDGLSWSADGRSLYLSCALVGNPGGHATFVVDSATGAAVVDAQGRWRSIAPIAEVDARGTLLVGVGLERVPNDAATERPLGASRFRSLLAIDLAEAKTNALLPAAFAARNAPTYAGAHSPALSPDGTAVVFATFGQGLWLVDTQSRDCRRLTGAPGDDAPRWTEDGKRILFLSHAANGDLSAAVVDNLYEIPSPPPGGVPDDRSTRRLLLRDVVRFFVVPE